ncbi:MAG: hypothetical protein K6F99_04070 [Lachnospiraceae bacterium]|nr:hypothetical protein [Lachnospiraceae bacterium]
MGLGAALDYITDNDRAGYEPLPSYNFVMQVEGLFYIPLKSVRAFTKENEYEYIQEGGVNDYVHMIRKSISKPFTFQVEKYVGQRNIDQFDPIANGTELMLPIFLWVYRSTAKRGFSDKDSAPEYFGRLYTFTGCSVTNKEYGELNAEKSGLLTEVTTIAYRELVVITNIFESTSVGEVFDFKKAAEAAASGKLVLPDNPRIDPKVKNDKDLYINDKLMMAYNWNNPGKIPTDPKTGKPVRNSENLWEMNNNGVAQLEPKNEYVLNEFDKNKMDLVLDKRKMKAYADKDSKDKWDMKAETGGVARPAKQMKTKPDLIPMSPYDGMKQKLNYSSGSAEDDRQWGFPESQYDLSMSAKDRATVAKGKGKQSAAQPKNAGTYAETVGWPKDSRRQMPDKENTNPPAEPRIWGMPESQYDLHTPTAEMYNTAQGTGRRSAIVPANAGEMAETVMWPPTRRALMADALDNK